MQHFPIFVSTTGKRVVLSGGADAAIAKLRLLLKTEAHLSVFSADPAEEIAAWAETGRLKLYRRQLGFADLEGALLVYAANDDAKEDARVGALARNRGILVNLVDNLGDSAFITPCIVDRDPVTVAIGTEGAAPVLARAIKADIEERLPFGMGLLAQIGKRFREHAEALPMGRKRRDFWRDYYFQDGPRALRDNGADGVGRSLETLLSRYLSQTPRKGRVDLVGAGPGDPELLTMRARRLLDEADVVLHDRLVAPEILELARREALIVETGKEGFGEGIAQDEINALMIHHARKGAQVVRLKSGDPSVFGRLDEEIEALDAAGVEWSVTPGITAASAGAASVGASLTRRNRNSGLRLLSAHDTKGFADHDWQALARPGEVAGFYMAKRAARFLQGRLLMHGADPATPVTIVEYASRRDERRIASTLGALSADLDAAGLTGPAILLFGIASRAMAEDFQTHSREEIAL